MRAKLVRIAITPGPDDREYHMSDTHLRYEAPIEFREDVTRDRAGAYQRRASSQFGRVAGRSPVRSLSAGSVQTFQTAGSRSWPEHRSSTRSDALRRRFEATTASFEIDAAPPGHG